VEKNALFIRTSNGSPSQGIKIRAAEEPQPHEPKLNREAQVRVWGLLLSIDWAINSSI